jgi:hypothetical protein
MMSTSYTYKSTIGPPLVYILTIRELPIYAIHHYNNDRPNQALDSRTPVGEVLK